MNSSEWNQATNWSNGLPGPFNEPTIPATPQGTHFPVVSIYTYFNFNVQNYGSLTVNGDGGVSLFGILINHSGGTLVLSGNATNLLVEASGTLENHGNIVNNGTFKNEGNFTNANSGSFNNNHVFSHSVGSFLNSGQFSNFGEFYTEASYQNTGTFNNHGLFNNNENASNAGSFHSAAASTLRNDFNLTNLAGGNMNISGVFLNNKSFENQGVFTGNAGSKFTNSKLVRNSSTANWSNQGELANVLCAIFENKGSLGNTSLFENEGFIYADLPITGNPPSNSGSGVVISPSNTSSLCHNVSISLAANNVATVQGLELANNQLDFCSSWTILVNGFPNFSYTGCASVGPHPVTVSFIDPYGRTTNCQAIVTVVDDLAPIIVCPPTVTINLSAGQCTAPANLAVPTVLVENCTVASIANNALPALPIGQTAVTWTVTDQNGNAGYCIQNVLVVDQMPPNITCPPTKTMNNDPGFCGVSKLSPAIAGDPAFAFDNCGTPIVTNNAPTIIPVGTNTITWIATDASGNTSTCPQTIKVNDNQPPQIVVCPPDISVEVQGAGCQAIATWGAALVTDNCSVPTQVFSTSSGSVFDLGTSSVTLLVSDAALNTATCEFKVTVKDTQAPTWSNCPSNSTVTLLNCGDIAIGNWIPPTANDPCLASVVSNIQPGDVLSIGQNNVVYTAKDWSGNSSTCSFKITVNAILALDCPADIVVSIPANETASFVDWNPPPGATNCTVCASVDVPGFQFLGEKSGHRYYIYLGGELSWPAANDIAVQHGGYLAAIEDSNENDLLRKAFGATFQTAWIGYNDLDLEGVFKWTNGEPSTFSNWLGGLVTIDDSRDFALLRNDGTWLNAGTPELHTFIMEIPCYQLDITSSNPTALSSRLFPLGNTTIEYEVLDNCGNICSCGFQVQVVQNQPVASCASKGDSGFGWIQKVQAEGFVNDSGDDGGRGNFMGMDFKLPDPGCILKLSPGGQAINNYLYWRVWADFNKDGDFFDDNEILGSVEGVGEQQLCYDVVPSLPTSPIPMRISMSHWDFAAACGNFMAGETEDYLVSFVDSSSFNLGNCDWSFGLFQAEVEALKIQLQWLGSNICEVDYFGIERSEDGVLYEELGKVTPYANGPQQALYEFEDNTPLYGHSFYRIRVVMEDSSEVVSSLVEADFNADVPPVFIYPNPAADEAILHIFPFNGLPARLFIADAKGQLVYDRHYPELGNSPLKLDLTGFAQGVYLVYLKADTKREVVRRMVVLRP
ncbi:MAG: HYR domain-containing protein [Saprospiraceae bacterium]|nr:HYR domain-containing protein [Saprospiraceae bacterium]